MCLFQDDTPCLALLKLAAVLVVPQPDQRATLEAELLRRLHERRHGGHLPPSFLRSGVNLGTQIIEHLLTTHVHKPLPLGAAEVHLRVRGHGVVIVLVGERRAALQNGRGTTDA